MHDARARARAYGIAVELADLGAWGAAALISEYDPDGPLIRVNARELPPGPPAAVRAHVERAIVHELYHHREAIGEVPRLAGRAARERAAAAHEL